MVSHTPDDEFDIPHETVAVPEPESAAPAVRRVGTDIRDGVYVGSLLWGTLIPFTGYRGMYVAAAVVAGSCLLLYWALYGRHVGRG